MRVLVTGSAGFIGFHLAGRLLDDGHAVVGFDGMTSYYDVALKKDRLARLLGRSNFQHVNGMLEDMDALLGAGEMAGPDVIVHLAAQAGVRYSLESPRAYLDSNIVGSFNVLELARRLKPKHLLLASTSSVYGANEKMPFAEGDRADEALTIYAASKKAMEGMAHAYAHLHGLPTTIFRFFTVYGPWGRPDMAPARFMTAIERGESIDVYGHGQMRRDFTYIDDLVEAVVRLMAVVPAEANRVPEIDSLSRVAPLRVVNIGGGQPVELMDFIAAIETALGRSAHRRMLPVQPGEVPATFANADLLKALTGICADNFGGGWRQGVRRLVQGLSPCRWVTACRSSPPALIAGRLVGAKDDRIVICRHAPPPAAMLRSRKLRRRRARKPLSIRCGSGRLA